MTAAVDFKHRLHWAIPEVDPGVLLANLPQILGPDFTLVFEGVDIGEEARQLYREHRAPELFVRKDTLWPPSQQYYVRASPAFFAEIRQLLTELPPSKLFNHIKAARDGFLLLWAHDADTAGAALFHVDAPEEEIRRFAEAIRQPYSQEAHLNDQERCTEMAKLERAIGNLHQRRPWWKRLLHLRQ